MIHAAGGGLDYNEWFVLATVLTRFDGHGGRRFFHSLSSVDGEKYDAVKADKKYDNILSTMKATGDLRHARELWLALSKARP